MSVESVLKVKASDHTIANYVEFLQDAFLFTSAQRWEVKGKQYVVNRAPGKLYIQVAYELPNEAKREQEMLPRRKCDDFFRKMIVVGAYTPLHYTSDGIIEVGAIPFLLDASILDKALAD